MEPIEGDSNALVEPYLLPLLDLPGPCLRAVVVELWADLRDVAALSCCCTATAQLCAEQQLWKQLLTSRYGKSVLPGEAAAGPAHPARLPGWVFFQGMDASLEGDKAAEGWDSLERLAETCSSKGAGAFTTSGKLISSPDPPDSWKRTTYRPCEGLYVREEISTAMHLQQQIKDPGSAAKTWPPAIQGWVYFPSCYSSGYTKKEAGDNMARHPTLQNLLHQAAGDSQVVAVTTRGETKTKLRPQWCWSVTPRYDEGMYVKTHVVREMQLRMPSPEIDYRAVAARLSGLRLCAAQMSAAWVNDQYLTLKSVPASLGCHGTALKLNSVWWLDISGDIVGVPPGRYEVVWVLALPRNPMGHTDHVSFHMSAATESMGLEHMPITTATDNSSGGSSSGSSGSNGGTSGSSDGPSAGASVQTAAAAAADLLRSLFGGGSGSRAAAAPPAAADNASNSTAATVSTAGVSNTSSSGAVAVEGDSNEASSGSSSSSSVALTLKLRQMAKLVKPLQLSAGHTEGGVQWGSLSGGFITVSDISTVHLKFWSHEDWKGDMHWAYVELRPVLPKAQQQAQQQRRQQWQQWWQQRRLPVGGSSSRAVDRAARGDGGGGVARVGRLLGLRRGFLQG